MLSCWLPNQLQNVATCTCNRAQWVTSFRHIGLLEKRKASAVPQFVLEMIFTCVLGQLLCILEDPKELWVSQTNVHYLVIGVKAVLAIYQVENWWFRDVGRC